MSTSARHAGPPIEPARTLRLTDAAPDWGAGRYETFAARLQPAADRVIALASPQPREETLDLACGTGNAALLAARVGACVTGLDQSSRLIDVARSRAQVDHLDAAFVVGDLHDIPFADDAFDLVLSVFGVIFARDPRIALAGVLRVLTPAGRAFIAVWEPGGATSSVSAICGQAVGAALGAELPRFDWSDQAALGQLTTGLGATVCFHAGGEIISQARSPEEFLERQDHHPLMIGARRLLQRAGTWEAVRRDLLQAVRAQNEEPAAFRTTSRYLVIEVRHNPPARSTR